MPVNQFKIDGRLKGDMVLEGIADITRSPFRMQIAGACWVSRLGCHTRSAGADGITGFPKEEGAADDMVIDSSVAFKTWRCD